MHQMTESVPIIPMATRDIFHSPKEIGPGQCLARAWAALIGLVHEHVRQLQAWRTDTGSLVSRKGGGPFTGGNGCCGHAS